MSRSELAKERSRLVYNAGSSIFNVMLENSIGYLGASCVGAASAAAVGSLGVMAGAGLIGSAALYIPVILLKRALDAAGMMNSLLDLSVDVAFTLGSAAVGAMIFGLAVQPFIMCAVVGTIISACLSYMFSPKPEDKPQATASVEPMSPTQNCNRMFSTRAQSVPAPTAEDVRSGLSDLRPTNAAAM